jgi:hypothetical protein
MLMEYAYLNYVTWGVQFESDGIDECTDIVQEVAIRNAYLHSRPKDEIEKMESETWVRQRVNGGWTLASECEEMES